jgi:hypothetical protein
MNVTIIRNTSLAEASQICTSRIHTIESHYDISIIHEQVDYKLKERLS